MKYYKKKVGEIYRVPDFPTPIYYKVIDKQKRRKGILYSMIFLGNENYRISWFWKDSCFDIRSQWIPKLRATLLGVL